MYRVCVVMEVITHCKVYTCYTSMQIYTAAAAYTVNNVNRQPNRRRIRSHNARVYLTCWIGRCSTQLWIMYLFICLLYIGCCVHVYARLIVECYVQLTRIYHLKLQHEITIKKNVHIGMTDLFAMCVTWNSTVAKLVAFFVTRGLHYMHSPLWEIIQIN